MSPPTKVIAVGRTPDTTGTVVVDAMAVAKADFEVDMTTIKFAVTATTHIVLADYGIAPPKLGFVTVGPADDLELALRLTK